jgi:hypothetical protein
VAPEPEAGVLVWAARVQTATNRTTRVTRMAEASRGARFRRVAKGCMGISEAAPIQGQGGQQWGSFCLEALLGVQSIFVRELQFFSMPGLMRWNSALSD